jgi:hypothetical protein
VLFFGNEYIQELLIKPARILKPHYNNMLKHPLEQVSSCVEHHAKKNSQPADKAGWLLQMVRMEGLEPPHLTASDPKSDVSTNFTTSGWRVANVGERSFESSLVYKFTISLVLPFVSSLFIPYY